MSKHQLKSIAKESVPRALEKAERYRLLNEPFLAESICLDILAIEPDDETALVTYVLALTDQFGTGGAANVKKARAAVAKMKTEYAKHYYSGLICERRGQAYAESNAMGSRDAAWDYIAEAMECYEKAAADPHEKGNDDPTLRWNTCVRLIEAHGLVEPSVERSEHPLE
jgi:hypothetical protein